MQIISTIEPQYFLSILASAFGCSLFYVYSSRKIYLIEYFKSLFGCIAFGVIALAVAKSYYPANSDMINIAVIPFFAGVSMPQVFRGYVKLLQKFADNPEESMSFAAKLYNIVKGNKSKDKTKNGDKK